MKHFSALLSVFLTCTSLVFAQEYKGIWTGYMRAEAYNVSVLDMQYVLHIKDQNQNIVNGKAYLFRRNPLSAEGVLDFIGVVNGDKLKISELKILHSKIPSDTTRFLCIKNLSLSLTQEEGVDNLNGTFDGAGENLMACYPGKVYLQRFNAKNEKTIPQNILTTLLLDDKDPNVFLKTKLARPIIIEVTNNVLQLEISDYLKEDGDIISVYHNRRQFLKNHAIVNKKSSHTLRLTRNIELHELILYAENLGRIPPNTSTLTVVDGAREHKVLIQSSKEVSAVVYLRYNPQKSPAP